MNAQAVHNVQPIPNVRNEEPQILKPPLVGNPPEMGSLTGRWPDNRCCAALPNTCCRHCAVGLTALSRPLDQGGFRPVRSDLLTIICVVPDDFRQNEAEIH